jgi:hypothetical protein
MVVFYILFQVDLANRQIWILDIYELTSRAKIFSFDSTQSSSLPTSILVRPVHFLEDRLVVHELVDDVIKISVWDFKKESKVVFQSVPENFGAKDTLLEVKPLQLIFIQRKKGQSPRKLSKVEATFCDYFKL